MSRSNEVKEDKNGCTPAEGIRSEGKESREKFG
jgi:hypothetical protein